MLVLVNIIPTWHSSNEVGTFLSPSDQVNFVTFSSSSVVLVNAARKFRSSARIVAHSYTYSSHEFHQYVTEKICFLMSIFPTALGNRRVVGLSIRRRGWEPEVLQLMPVLLGLIFSIASEAALIRAKISSVKASFSILTVYIIAWLSFQAVFVLYLEL